MSQGSIMEQIALNPPKRINYINIPFLNTGSVADIQIKLEANEKLDKLLDKLEKSLIEDRQKFNMDEFFAKRSL